MDNTAQDPIVTFNTGTYRTPNGIVGMSPVRIGGGDIYLHAEGGATWEQLAQLYQVEVTELQKHFQVYYDQGRAKLEIELIRSMVKYAHSGNATMMKWLSANWLNFAEKQEVKTETTESNADEVDAKLAKLLKQLNGNATDKADDANDK